MFSRRLLPWLFAVFLLVGQAAAFAHALEHLDPHGVVPDHACEFCVAQATLGGGPVGKSFVPSAEAVPYVVPVAAAQPTGRLALRHARARAPPASV